ncbi:MAG: hypothetical protein P9F19_02975 [Candidatus Contendobacter sp.]|nr:hypothetical protein [Candidatus Contendobacter sp.]MDG4556347.1 hypothetical protein [Candidatus Contendobacter sp.]
MKALATFVMRGRSTAALVAAVAAVLLWLFPPFLIVSGAALALVTLRRGAAEGAWLMALAGVGAVALTGLTLGTPWPMLDVLPVYWLPLWLLALVLRATVSLSRAFQAAALLGLLGVAGFYLVLGDPAIWWGEVLGQWERTLASLALSGQPAAADRATLDQLLALLREWAPYLPGQAVGAVLLFVLAGLLLGRWHQSLLFNPGGFRPEFHQLRLGSPLAAFTLGLFGAAMLSGWPPLANAALVLSLLYTVQGVALVHAVAFKRRLSAAWLLLFYLLLMIPPLSQGVMALGVVDAWADFRNRIRPRSGQC